MILRFIFAISMIVILSITVAPQDLPKFSARVRLAASGSDGIRDRIASSIGRHLRALGDVIITEDEPDYTIRIVAIAPKPCAGYTPDVWMSVVITQNVTPSMVGMISKQLRNGGDHEAQTVLKVFSDFEWIDSTETLGGPISRLDDMAADIVSSFDIKTLKPARDIQQKIVDLFRKGSGK